MKSQTVSEVSELEKEWFEKAKKWLEENNKIYYTYSDIESLKDLLVECVGTGALRGRRYANKIRQSAVNYSATYCSCECLSCQRCKGLKAP
jgi:hypothetical protein